jgi:hypothetical protein
LKNGYHFRNNIVKDERGDLATDCHSILARWRDRFSQVLNVCGVNDFGKTEINIAERIVPETSVFEFKVAIEKLKRYKSSGMDQIPTELIKQGVE